MVTTEEDSPGVEQARAAVASGADLVIAWGGDGTVRSVAEGVAGSDATMAIIPAGTGNLLARNLGLPLSLDDAGAIAFDGVDRQVDVIEVGLGGEVTTCTVIAGMGVDAVLIDASEGLKSAIGPSAYALNSVRALRQKKMRVGVAVDGGAPRWYSARSVMVANVGGLVAGLDVVPEAEVSDGLLHVVVLPLANPVDWARTGARIALRRAGTTTRATTCRARASGSWRPRRRHVRSTATSWSRDAASRPGCARVRCGSAWREVGPR